jgi:rhodanese-related sulfurtransferase
LDPKGAYERIFCIRSLSTIERYLYCFVGCTDSRREHIPVNELSQKLKVLEKHREKEIICYCHSGRRSFTATLMLTNNGFQAANMKGGMIEWNYLGLKK